MDKNREESIRSRNWSEKFKDEGAADVTEGSGSQDAEFNARVHQALAGIPVPPTLRDQILARRKIVAVPFWKQSQNIASIAAVLLVLATGLVFFTRLLVHIASILHEIQVRKVAEITVCYKQIA